MALPGRLTRVVPDAWSAHHRPVAERTMTAECVVTHAGTGAGTFDATTGVVTPPARTTVYTGACRVQALAGDARAPVTADQQVSIRGYRVSLPITGDTGAAVPATVRVDVEAVVEVLACPDDPTLAGRMLRVTDVVRGSLLWQRDLICVDDLG